jgi:L-rhamnose isomerase/sugar isomerase
VNKQMAIKTAEAMVCNKESQLLTTPSILPRESRVWSPAVPIAFLIFNELVEGMDAKAMNHATDLAWMIDASHNVKDPMEDLLQSIEAIMIAYAQALIVDTNALKEAQSVNDVVKAQEILQTAFRTDVRPLVAEARMQSGGALQPIQLFRSLKVRKQLIQERGVVTVATGL